MFYSLKKRRLFEHFRLIKRQIEIDPLTRAGIWLPGWLWDWFDLGTQLHNFSAAEYCRHLVSKLPAGFAIPHNVILAMALFADMQRLKREFWRCANDNSPGTGGTVEQNKALFFGSADREAANFLAQQRNRRMIAHCFAHWPASHVRRITPDFSEKWRDVVAANIHLAAAERPDQA